MTARKSVATATKPLALDRITQTTLRNLRKLKAEKATLDAKIRTAEGKLKAALGDAEEATVRGVVVVTYKRAIRSGVDLSVLKKAHPEIARECIRDREVRTLLLVEEE